MKQRDLNELEMELRVLGRQLSSQKPPATLIRQAQDASALRLAQCSSGIALAHRRRLVFGTLGLLTLTLPIPLLFLWGEWAATSALLGRLLSPTLLEIVSGAYLWLRFCILCLVYALMIPAVLFLALRIHSPQVPDELRQA